MDILNTAYPNFYRGNEAPDAVKTLALWGEMFRDDDPGLVAAAVKALIATDTKGFPPHIGAVKEKMRQIVSPEQNTEAEAWGLVLHAISRGIYSAKAEFEELPMDIQRIVGSPNQIREWAMMDADTVNSVVASNFQRSYRARMKQKEELDALPADVRKMIDLVSSRLKKGLDSASKTDSTLDEKKQAALRLLCAGSQRPNNESMDGNEG